jgi:hypothetical protein
MTRRLAVTSLLLAALVGCGQSRSYTFVTDPADAEVRLNGEVVARRDRPRTVTFASPQQTYSLVASRFGYEDASRALTQNDPSGEVRLALVPRNKSITLMVEPVAAEVLLDGKPISSGPVESMTFDLPFTLGPDGESQPRRIRAIRKGFTPVDGQINFTDPTGKYVLRLEPLKKPLRITTTPAGATIAIDGVAVGTSPLELPATTFEYDVAKEQFVAKKLTATRAGYAPTDATLSWDDGKQAYDVPLDPLKKQITIITDPPEAVVKLDGVELKPNAAGDRVVNRTFVPLDDAGTLPTIKVDATLSRPGEIWKPLTATIAWDEGKPSYHYKLEEILTRVVPTKFAAMSLDAQNVWKFTAQSRETAGVKDTADGDLGTAKRITDLPAGSNIDSYAISPDGRFIVCALLIDTPEGKTPRAKLMLQRTDGTGGVTQLTDGRSLDVTPSFSPAGDRVLFSSDRGGARMHLWSVAVDGQGGAQRLTAGDSDHLWPTLDSAPKPTVYYEARIAGQPEPRLFATPIGTVSETDLVKINAHEPRLSPRNDAIVFTSRNSSTGKGEIYRVSEKGQGLVALTNTPDVDERDPAWSADGSRIAFTTEVPAADGKPAQTEIMSISSAGNDPKPVTKNDSLDDQPVFDPTGDAVYFRSNRGGKWDVWRIDVK